MTTSAAFVDQRCQDRNGSQKCPFGPINGPKIANSADPDFLLEIEPGRTKLGKKCQKGCSPILGLPGLFTSFATFVMDEEPKNLPEGRGRRG